MTPFEIRVSKKLPRNRSRVPRPAYEEGSLNRAGGGDGRACYARLPVLTLEQR